MVSYKTGSLFSCFSGEQKVSESKARRKREQLDTRFSNRPSFSLCVVLLCASRTFSHAWKRKNGAVLQVVSKVFMPAHFPFLTNSVC